MKTLFLAASTFLFSIASVFAGPASEAAKAYYTTLKTKDYPAAAKHFDPAALKSFREMLSFFNELPDEEAADTLSMFFGEGATKDSVKKMSDSEFFAAFLKGLMQEAEEAGGVEFGDFQVLGEVPEGEDVIHVVTRNKVGVGELKIESMEVMSFKKAGDSWKAMLNGEMSGVAAQLKAAFGKPPEDAGEEEKAEEGEKAEEE
jgi:hypothetical protein